MNALDSFRPSLRKGLIFNIGLFLFLGAAGGYILLTAIDLASGSYFILWLLATLLVLAPLPLIAYRAYALLQASYVLERDGLRLRWGLRAVDIPLNQVEWVKRLDEMGVNIPLPPLSWPGAVLGTREVEGLGKIEFLASDKSELLLVAADDAIYAISPADQDEFIRSFQSTIEMGSLAPLAAYSTRPIAFIQSVWADKPARTMVIAASGFLVILFILVSLVIPFLDTLVLGYNPGILPAEPAPPDRLLLLPLLSLFTYIVDLSVGLFLYRRLETRPASYLLWFASSITSILLIAAVIAIL